MTVNSSYQGPPPLDSTTSKARREDPQISLHALSNIFFAPQTLKLISCITNCRVIVFVHIDTTHNFMYRRVVEETNCYVYAAHGFRIMTAIGGMMKWRGNVTM